MKKGEFMAQNHGIPEKLQRRLDSKSRRGDERGRAKEQWVAECLGEMKEEGIVIDYRYNEPNSPEDSEGKDFRVWIMCGGQKEFRDFQVTISMRSKKKHLERKPRVPVKVVTENMRMRTMKKWIIELFDEPSNSFQSA